MKKQLLAGIMTVVFAGTCVPTVFANTIMTSVEKTYAAVINPTPSSNGTINYPHNNYPSNNPTVGTITVRPNSDSYKPGKSNGHYKKPHKSSGKLNKHRPHKNKQHKEHVKPNRPNNGTYKPSNPAGVYKPNKPNNPTGVYKPNKPNRPNNGTYKPSNPTGVYKPNKPNNGTYKPVKPSTGSKTRVHGAHWCYGACSLHDAGLHNAPRTEKHWCDGYR